MDLVPSKTIELRSRQLARLHAIGLCGDRNRRAPARDVRYNSGHARYHGVLGTARNVKTTRTHCATQWNVVTKDSIDMLGHLLGAPEAPPAFASGPWQKKQLLEKIDCVSRLKWTGPSAAAGAFTEIAEHPNVKPQKRKHDLAL